ATLRVPEAVSRPLHRDKQVAVGDVAAGFEVTAHALALLLRHHEVDVLGRPAKQVHDLPWRVAVQPDSRRADHPQRDAGIARFRDDPDGLRREVGPLTGVRRIHRRGCLAQKTLTIQYQPAHSIGICWNASLMLMPRRFLY